MNHIMNKALQENQMVLVNFDLFKILLFYVIECSFNNL